MDDEGRISRWSRLKRRNTIAAAKPAPPPTVVVVNDGEGEVPPQAEVKTEIAPEDLPDPDTLDKDSDFTAFLGDGVPEAIKRKALSVLWRSDPILANLDGLNDYDEDYSLGGGICEAVSSAYRAGKGYLEDESPSENEVDAEVPVGASETGDVAENRESGDAVSAGRKTEPLK